MSQNIAYYLPFYLGCRSNQGKILGINENWIFIQLTGGKIIESDINSADLIIKPFLKNLNSLSNDQSSELIKRGMNIGRPKGYSFSPEAFLYLLTLHVDIFGLIESGLALDIDNTSGPLEKVPVIDLKKRDEIFIDQ